MAETPKRRAKRRFEIKVVKPNGDSVRFFGDDLTMTPEALDAMTPLCDAVVELMGKHVAAKTAATPPTAAPPETPT